MTTQNAHTRTGGTRPRQRRKKRSGKAPLILCAVLAVLLLLFLLYRFWAKAPDVPGSEPALGQTDGDQPYLTGDRKPDFFTFLIVGRDTGGGGNTDTIMLAAYDIANQQAALMSIPRDTMVNVSWDVKKINSVFNMNRKNGEDAAISALADTVAGLVGFRPDYTITMEWEAVGAIVDAIGGVYFDVPFDMHYSDPYQDLYIDQAAGYRLLTGADAMQVVRWRKNNGGVPNPQGTDGSDLGRTAVQQDFIAAVLKQCLQIQNVTRISEIASVFTDYVSTELSVGNLVWFAEQALLGGFSTENLYACTMPGSPKSVYSQSYKANLSYVIPNGGELLPIVNEHFNPYKTDVTLANLDLMQPGSGGGPSSGGSGTSQPAQSAPPAADPPPAQSAEVTPPAEEPSSDPEPAEPESPGGENPEFQPPEPGETPEPLPEESELPASLPEENPAPPPAEPDPSQSEDLFTLPDGVT